MADLNELTIEVDYSPKGRGGALEDYSITDGAVHVYLKKLEEHLIRHIRAADVIVGCVAWLTSEPILKALGSVGGVALVVQKEDFLRPDLNARSGWKRNLRRLYDSLHEGPSRYAYSPLVDSLSVCSDPTLAPVRCVGHYNANGNAAFPRMHHKFLVFCKRSPQTIDDYDDVIKPYAVWTGSFNLTANAAQSFENAVVLTQPDIVDAYFMEWQQIEALSEPLDWTSEWAAPEWRIGT